MVEPSIVSEQRPGRLQRLAAGLVVAAGVAVTVIAFPVANRSVAADWGVMLAFGSIAAFADLFTAVLLIGRARATESRAAIGLAAAYLFSCLTMIAQVLSFPGAAVIGGADTMAWLWCAGHAGFALFVGAFALSAKNDTSSRRYGLGVLTIAVMGAAGAVLLATLGLPFLPKILAGDDYARLNALGIGPLVAACIVGALALVMTQLRARNTATLWLAVAMAAISLSVGLGLAGAARFTIGWYLGGLFGLVGHVVVFVALLFESMGLYSRVSEANRHLERLSLTDQLTQLANRRAFEAHFAVEWRRAEREMLPISLLMIDVDRFKGFNDRFGHPAGDRCLRLVADTLGEMARRPLDLAARMGGEEFVILLPNTEAAGAAWMGEHVRSAIATLQITNPGSVPGIVTVSVGVATAYPRPQHGGGAAELIERADMALYEAKHLGRNNVHAFGPGSNAAYPADAMAWCAADTVSQIS